MELGTPPKYGTEANPLAAHHAAVDVHVFGNRNVNGQRRSNFLLLLFRALSFFFSLAAVVVMGSNKHGSQKSLGTTMIHIGECTQLPAQYELDQCSAVEVLSSSSRYKKHCVDLSKFSLFKIHNDHCRFA
jgi:hypothetical protein